MKCIENKAHLFVPQLLLFVLVALFAQVKADVAVKIFSRDEALTETNMSKPRIYIQNTGNVALSGVKFYYYFTIESNKTPVLDNYYSPDFTVSLLNVTGATYKVEYTLTNTLNIGAIVPGPDGNVVGLHYNDWSAWSKTNDYSNKGSATFVENQLIPVYYNGVKIYGIEPGEGSTPPPPVPQEDIRLNSFALYSTVQTVIKERSVFNGGGAIGSNGSVEIYNNAVVHGNVVSGGNATLWHEVLIDGDIILKGTLIQNGMGNQYNNLQEGVTVATLSLPNFAVTTSSNHITVNQSATRTLAAGIYGDLNVLQDGTLILSPGNYTFGKFYIENGAKVIFQIGNYQDKIDISSAGEFDLQDRAELKFATSFTYAPSVQIYSRDQNELRIGVGVKTVGIITAPFATVNMYSGARCDGAIYAKNINVEPDAIINSTMVDPNRDDDGDGVPTGIEIDSVINTDPLNPASYKPVAIPDQVVIDNTNEVVVKYDLSRFYGSYSQVKFINVIYPANSLTNPKKPLILQLFDRPPTGVALVNDAVYSQLGKYFLFNGNKIKSGSTVYTGLASPNNSNATSYSSAVFKPDSNKWNFYNDPFDMFLPDDPRLYLCSYDDVAPAPLKGTTGSNQYVTGVVYKKVTNVTSYSNDGTIFTSNGSEIVVNCAISNVTDVSEINPGTVEINYTDLSSGVTPPPIIVPLFQYKSVYCCFSSNEAPNNGFRLNSVTVKLNKSDGTPYTPVPKTINKDAGVGESYKIDIFCEQTALAKDESYSFYPTQTMSFESTPLGDDGLVQGVPSNYTYSYLLKDHLGSTRMVLNAEVTGTSRIAQALLYHPYGTINNVPDFPPASTDILREKFTGKEYDEEGEGNGISAYNFSARMYDPMLGVFLSVDQAGEFFNSYRYTTNPIAFIDPTGMGDGYFSDLNPVYQGYYGYNLFQPLDYNTDYQNAWFSSALKDLGGGFYNAAGGWGNIATNALGGIASPIFGFLSDHQEDIDAFTFAASQNNTPLFLPSYLDDALGMAGAYGARFGNLLNGAKSAGISDELVEESGYLYRTINKIDDPHANQFLKIGDEGFINPRGGHNDLTRHVQFDDTKSIFTSWSKNMDANWQQWSGGSDNYIQLRVKINTMPNDALDVSGWSHYPWEEEVSVIGQVKNVQRVR